MGAGKYERQQGPVRKQPLMRTGGAFMKKLWKKHKFIVLAVPLAVIVAVILVLAVRQMKTRAEVRNNIEAGNRYLEELDYERAIASYQQALDIDPKNVEANLGLAEAYDSNQMYAYAEAVYKDMLEQDDGQAEAYVKLAELYIRLEQLEEARDLLDTAVDKVENEEVSMLYEITRPEPPRVNHEEGAYSDRIRVELIPAEESHTIYYTLDGTEPTKESALYTEPLILRNGVTSIKTISMNSTGYSSDIATYEYDIQIEDVLVTLEEPVIERIIREKLSIPYGDPIYNDDIEQITQIYIVGNQVQTGENRYSVFLEEYQYTVDSRTYSLYGEGEIATLNDLRYMPFLEKVVVEYQPGLDISALASCSRVTELSLVGDGLENNALGVLSQMGQLTRLNLGWNEISDIQPLAALSNLTVLSVWGNQIRSIEPAGSLTQLVYLDFSDNQVSDIQPLSGLTNLQQLWMYRNQVTDIGAVTALSALQVLMVRDNPIGNPEAVRSIYPHLTRIDVDLLNLGTAEAEDL